MAHATGKGAKRTADKVRRMAVYALDCDERFRIVDETSEHVSFVKNLDLADNIPPAWLETELIERVPLPTRLICVDENSQGHGTHDIWLNKGWQLRYHTLPFREKGATSDNFYIEIVGMPVAQI